MVKTQIREGASEKKASIPGKNKNRSPVKPTLAFVIEDNIEHHPQWVLEASHELRWKHEMNGLRLSSIPFTNSLKACLFLPWRNVSKYIYRNEIKLSHQQISYIPFIWSGRAGALQIGHEFFINNHFLMQSTW